MISAEAITKVLDAAEELLRTVDRFSLHYGTSEFDEDADRLQDAIEAFRRSECPGCREELGGKLICQCHPELEATHGRDEEDAV